MWHDAYLFQYAPILSFALYLLLSTWIIVRFPLGGNRSISEHIARSGRYFRVSSVVFSLIAVLLCATLLLWVGPSYHAESSFMAIAALFALSGLGLAWFPSDAPGSKKRTHHAHFFSVLALYLSVGLFSVIASTVALPEAPLTYIIAQWTFVIYVWLICLYFFYKPSHNHFIFYETIGIVAFFALFISLGLKL